MNNFKTLLWWMYQPHDEREQQLYLQAYKRCSYVFVHFIAFISFLYGLDYFNTPDYPTPLSNYVLFGLVFLVIALLIGSLVFRNQGVDYHGKKEGFFWNTLRNTFVMMVTLVLLNIVFKFYNVKQIDPAKLKPIEDFVSVVVGGIPFFLAGTLLLIVLYQTISRYLKKRHQHKP